jgi:pilus assembly protein FimV
LPPRDAAAARCRTRADPAPARDRGRGAAAGSAGAGAYGQRAAPSTASGGSYTVKSGDTLGKIANQNRGAASLDQMLVALFRANPDAFINKNMNLLKAGAQLSIPADAEAANGRAGGARSRRPERRFRPVSQSARAGG